MVGLSCSPSGATYGTSAPTRLMGANLKSSRVFGSTKAPSRLITAVALAFQRRRFGYRDAQEHLGAFARGTCQNEAPAQFLGSLAHPDQAVVLSVRQVNDGGI